MQISNKKEIVEIYLGSLLRETSHFMPFFKVMQKECTETSKQSLTVVRFQFQTSDSARVCRFNYKYFIFIAIENPRLSVTAILYTLSWP
jgi:hypothetical protein